MAEDGRNQPLRHRACIRGGHVATSTAFGSVVRMRTGIRGFRVEAREGGRIPHVTGLHGDARSVTCRRKKAAVQVALQQLA